MEADILFQQDGSVPAPVEGNVPLQILSLLVSRLRETPSDSTMSIRISVPRGVVSANRDIRSTRKAEKASGQAQHRCKSSHSHIERPRSINSLADNQFEKSQPCSSTCETPTLKYTQHARAVRAHLQLRIPSG
jgi:hypothetical protein